MFKKIFFIIAHSLHSANFGSKAGGVHKGKACYSVTRSTQELQELQEVHSIIARSLHSANFDSNAVEVHKGGACCSVTRSTQELQELLDLQSYKVIMLQS